MIRRTGSWILMMTRRDGWWRAGMWWWHSHFDPDDNFLLIITEPMCVIFGSSIVDRINVHRIRIFLSQAIVPVIQVDVIKIIFPKRRFVVLFNPCFILCSSHHHDGILTTAASADGILTFWIYVNPVRRWCDVRWMAVWSRCYHRRGGGGEWRLGICNFTEICWFLQIKDKARRSNTSWFRNTLWRRRRISKLLRTAGRRWFFLAAFTDNTSDVIWCIFRLMKMMRIHGGRRRWSWHEWNPKSALAIILLSSSQRWNSLFSSIILLLFILLEDPDPMDLQKYQRFLLTKWKEDFGRGWMKVYPTLEDAEVYVTQWILSRSLLSPIIGTIDQVSVTITWWWSSRGIWITCVCCRWWWDLEKWNLATLFSPIRTLLADQR